MQEILRQITETTRATEEVRSAIAQSDWAAREWRTIRRIKLEELLLAAYALDQWLDLQRSKWLHGAEVDVDGKPMDKIKLLATLYFPDLQPEAAAIWSAHQKAYMFILEAGGGAGAARIAMDPEAYASALENFKSGWAPFYTATRLGIASLEEKASQVMIEVASTS